MAISTKKISFFLVLGIVVGILLGLIMGPRVDVFISFENAFNIFLQTVILLYIPLSLMHGLGNLQPHEAGRLLFKAISFLLALWAITILSCLIAGVFIPRTEPIMITPSTNTESLVYQLFDFLVPRNPFLDVVQNILPPLAFFGLILGAAFMHEKTKEPLLGLLQGGTHILETMMVWLMIISPIKAVLHFAVVSGTVNVPVMHLVLYYVLGLVVMCIFLSLFVLPMLVSLLTPLKYSEVIGRFTFVGLASFGTGQPLIAFPFIAEVLQEIRAKYHFTLRDWRATYLLIAPLAFSFAQLGNLLAFFFAQFFSFFFHAPLSLGQEFVLPLFAIVLSIGAPGSSLQNLFLISKQLNLPEQTVLLLQELHHVVISFKVLLSASGVLCLIILVMMLHEKKLKRFGKTLIPFAAISAILLGIFFYIARITIQPKDDFTTNFKTKKLENVFDTLPKITMLPYPTEAERANFHYTQPVLNAVLARKSLRVAYDPHSPPYTYLNDDGQAVGFDIAFMAKLALDLNVDLELIPILFTRLEDDLNEGIYDIATSGIIMDLIRLKNIAFSDFYEKDENGFIALRSSYKKYMPLASLKLMKGVRIGARGALIPIAQTQFPLATVVENALWFNLEDQSIDLFIGNTRSNYMRAMDSTDLVCLNFGSELGTEYISYALGQKDMEWKNFINEWISLKKLSGFYADQYDYWFYYRFSLSGRKSWDLLDRLLKNEQ